MPELVPQRHERCAVARIEITKGNRENTKLVKSPEAHEEDDGLNAETAKPAETRARRRPAQPAASETKSVSQTQTPSPYRVCVCEALFVSWPAPRVVARSVFFVSFRVFFRVLRGQAFRLCHALQREPTR